MLLKELRLKNVRCFTDSTILCSQPWTLIVGDNGTGKTTIAEALYYLGYGKSFRSNKAAELFSLHTDELFISATLVGHDTVTTGCLKDGTGILEKQTKINGSPIHKYQELIDLYRVIVISADDGELIRGAPERRRTWIDAALSIQAVEYRSLLRKLRRVLEHRNTLLGGATPDVGRLGEQLSVWTAELETVSSVIRNMRKEWLTNVFRKAQALFVSWKEHDTLTFTYTQSSTTIDKEIHAKKSLFGAHLDDIMISRNGLDLRSLGSRGQQKMVALALKLSQGSEHANQLLVLDDVLTDLDPANIEHVIMALRDASQVICTIPQQESLIPKVLRSFGIEFSTIELYK